MNIEDLMKINEKAMDLEKELLETKNIFRKELKIFINNYFKGNIPKYLAVSKNQFIQAHETAFKLQRGEKGIYWVLEGYVTTVKDGAEVHGHSKKTFYQGEFEALSPVLQNFTIEAAKLLTRPIFPVIPKLYKGALFGNIAYELAKNEALGVLLIWRKSGASYVDRMTKSQPTDSGLNILLSNHLTHEQYEKWKQISLTTTNEEIKEIAKKIMLKAFNVELSVGGRLKKEVLLSKITILNELFDKSAISTAIKNIELHNSKKSPTQAQLNEVLEKANEITLKKQNENKSIVNESKAILINGVKYKA